MSQTSESHVRVSAVIVASDNAERAALVEALRALGVVVDVADDFPRGRECLTVTQPAILITELRLGEYNGLHLVLRAKVERPETMAIVLTRTADPVLQQEAAELGATLLVIREVDRGWIAPILAAVAPLLPARQRLAGKPVQGA